MKYSLQKVCMTAMSDDRKNETFLPGNRLQFPEDRNWIVLSIMAARQMLYSNDLPKQDSPQSFWYSFWGYDILLFVTAAAATGRHVLLPSFILVGWAQELFKWQSVFAAKVNKLDVSHSCIKIDSWAARVQTSMSTLKVPDQLRRKVFNGVFHTIVLNTTSTQFKKRRWWKCQVSYKAHHQWIISQT